MASCFTPQPWNGQLHRYVAMSDPHVGRAVQRQACPAVLADAALARVIGANYALTETAINISISNRAPREYMGAIQGQIESGQLVLGEIVDRSELARNLTENAVPHDLNEVEAGTYPEFLARCSRRCVQRVPTDRGSKSATPPSSRPEHYESVCTISATACSGSRCSHICTTVQPRAVSASRFR